MESSTDGLKVYEDGEDWVIAKDPQDAVDVWEEHLSQKREPDADRWTERPAEKPLTIDLDDRQGRVTLTPAEWVQRMGRCFLASRNW